VGLKATKTLLKGLFFMVVLSKLVVSQNVNISVLSALISKLFENFSLY